jgi:carboxylesterase type B
MKPSTPGVASAPTVELRQGKYIGATIPSDYRYPKPIEAFRGIPYAKSPVGPLRFSLPQALPASGNVFDAVVFGQACPSSNVGHGVEEGEDCLNLNLYRPVGSTTTEDGKPAALLPVIVYVHGGGFNGGMGIERNMASFVSWAKQPLVSVSFNYRVGALGFLPAALTARQGLLNLGLKDQQLLFQWVQENISKFGGDPENVTIMGLSAGAHSVSPTPPSSPMCTC